MHHHTEKESSLFSLLSNLLSSSLSSPLLSLSLSVSVSAWCGGSVVVGCGVVWCVVCGVCVVCDTLKTPCMPAPRAHVFSTCARGAGIHGDVLNVYQVEGEGERVGGRRQPRVFHR